MNLFTSGHRHQPWLWQVTALCFILGLLLAGSLQTVRNISRSGTNFGRVGLPPSSPIRVEAARKEEREKEIAGLRERITELENALAEGSSQAETLNKQLQEVKLLAGLTEVRGPGIVLTLQDSQKRPTTMRAFEAEKYIIHDVDLQQAVHELFASGAEAVAVNDQRIIGRSAIRCVGPTIQVNGTAIVPPFEIKAIGDPGALIGGLNLPLGFLDNLRRFDPDMFKLEKRGKLALPAYTGSTETRYVKPVTESDRSGKDGSGKAGSKRGKTKP